MEQETALISVRPEADPKVTALYEEGIALKERAEALVILSNDDIRTATDELNVIAALTKALETKRKEYTVPLNDHLKEFNAAFKAFVAPIETANTITRDKILVYRKEQDRIRAAEEEINRKREEAAREEMALKGELTEDVNLVPVTPEAPTAYHSGFATAGVKRTWHFEIDDLAQLPREYMVPDMTKIRNVVIAMKQAGHPIPGVRAWQEEGLSITPQR